MKEVSAAKSRIPPQVFNAVAYGGEVACIKRRDGIKVYLVSETVIEALEDLMDGIYAREALDETKILKAIPLSKVKKDLGL